MLRKGGPLGEKIPKALILSMLKTIQCAKEKKRKENPAPKGF